MRKKKPWQPLIGLLVGLTLLLSACGLAQTENLSPLGAPSGGQVAVPDEAQEITSSVQQDLTEKLNVGMDAIRLVSIESMEWPDTSLGCPRPGMMYASVVTAGYKIVLEAEGQEYVYHTGPDSFVLCDESVTGERPAQGIRMDTEATVLAEQAQQDLSQQLGIAREDIDVLSVEAVQWPDASLGCPEPGKMYIQMVTPGYRIVLSAGGQEYVYHTDMKQGRLCNQQAR